MVLLFLFACWIALYLFMILMNKRFSEKVEQQQKTVIDNLDRFPNLKEIIQYKKESNIPILDDLKEHVDMSRRKSNVYIPMEVEDPSYEELCKQIAKEFHCAWGKFSDMKGQFPYKTGFFINAMDDDIRRFFFNEQPE